jgi:DNA-binding NtrC family response regulator
LNILIIDDNQQITSLLSKILITKGHDVISSNFFEDGLEKLREGNFDVMMMDAPLPGYEKLNVIKELEKMGILKSQKVILFTGLEISNSILMELKMKGLYSYLRKPLDVEKLIQTLSSVPLIKNTELTEKRISEDLTKKTFEDMRSNLSSLKLKLRPT